MRIAGAGDDGGRNIVVGLTSDGPYGDFSAGTGLVPVEGRVGSSPIGGSRSDGSGADGAMGAAGVSTADNLPSLPAGLGIGGKGDEREGTGRELLLSVVDGQLGRLAGAGCFEGCGFLNVGGLIGDSAHGDAVGCEFGAAGSAVRSGCVPVTGVGVVTGPFVPGPP